MDLGTRVLRLAVPAKVEGCLPGHLLVMMEIAGGSPALFELPGRNRMEVSNQAVLVVVGRR